MTLHVHSFKYTYYWPVSILTFYKFTCALQWQNNQLVDDGQ